MFPGMHGANNCDISEASQGWPSSREARITALPESMEQKKKKKRKSLTKEGRKKK